MSTTPHSAVPVTADAQVSDLLRRIHRVRRPSFIDMGVDAARDFYEQSSPILDIAAMPVRAVEDRAIPVPGGTIAARLYRGEGAPDRAPLVILSHGGGFTLGSINSYDRISRMLAARADCCVLSLDYRLAPEHRFPRAAEDVFAAWCWAADQAAELSIDARKLVGIGDSAGGTLTAQACLRARDAGLAIAGQVLIYPGVCAWQDTESHRRYGRGYLLDSELIQWFFSHYIDNADRHDWRFAPLEAPDHGNLPPTLVQLAQCDPLFDEGQDYAGRLAWSGTPVELISYDGAVHGFYNMGGALAVARRAHADTVQFLRTVFSS